MCLPLNIDRSSHIWTDRCVKNVRSGGRGLKATQVYPKLYGARVQRYHTKSVKDTFCACFFCVAPQESKGLYLQASIKAAVEKLRRQGSKPAGSPASGK